MNQKYWVLFAMAIALLTLSSIAGAQTIFGSPFWGCGWGWNTYATESVPYYALNPPVYYSFRVARTYGYSPFPYPPNVLTPGSQPPRSMLVGNPYAPRAEEEAGEFGREVQPLRIDNPFVEHPERAASARLSPTTHRPQVVYPAALASAPRESR
jgi:hypothetical protein